MTDELILTIDDDGVAREYNDTWDLTIHCEDEKVHNRVLEQLKSTTWHPVTGGDDWEPPLDDDGESNLLLLSFSNFPVPCIGFYRKDGESGAFYDEDNDDPLVSLNLIVNAWMPLPKCYREE